MALAALFTPFGRGLTATTVETVRFERPERIGFRLLRGPVPHVVETFELRESGDRTELEYQGELGTDLWRLGAWWGGRVAGPPGGRGEGGMWGTRARGGRRAKSA